MLEKMKLSLKLILTNSLLLAIPNLLLIFGIRLFINFDIVDLLRYVVGLTFIQVGLKNFIEFMKGR